MSSPAPRPPLRTPPGRRADYRWFHAITTRWSDNDMFMHVNNVVYFSYFDTAVTYYEMSEGVAEMIGGPIRAVVAEARCRYHRSLSYPDLVTVGLRAGRIGATSVTFELAVFRDEEDEACAEGLFVHVFVDSGTQRPVPIPDAARARLAKVSTI